IDAPLVTEISEPPPPRNPYWSRWISQLLVNEDTATELGTQIDALRAMGATTEERRRTVFQNGLRIHTTIDLELQGFAEQALMDHLTYEDEPAAEIAQEPMGAIVSVEPGTGAIRTMALGPYHFGDCAADGSWVGETDAGLLLCDRTQVNPAVPGGGGSGRQPGSSFKPILDAAALEDGISPGLVLDATGPQEFEGCPGVDGDDVWTVRNSGGDGILDMYEAVKRSSNVYHARIIAEIGPDKAADMGERLSGFPINERVCALALGANSMSPLGIATAYATFANRGEYCAPHPISRIEDANGRTIWEHVPDCIQVIDTEVADRVVDLLEGPVTPGGTAPEANLGEWE
ncbi:MAG: penicillin-binding transpeptidase domain-containing protein, partial [Actinomycetota bacterium]